MRSKSIFLKSTKYFLSFAIIGFIVLAGFICFAFMEQGSFSSFDLSHNSQQQDSHKPSDFCHQQGEILAGQNNSSLSWAAGQILKQNNQKIVFVNYDALIRNANLIWKGGSFFDQSEDLTLSQTSQLLTVIKIE